MIGHNSRRSWSAPPAEGLPPISAGLIHYWDFSEGAGFTIADRVGGNDATANFENWVPGRYSGNAMRAQGSDLRAVLADNTILNGMHIFTLCAQVKKIDSGAEWLHYFEQWLSYGQYRARGRGSWNESFFSVATAGNGQLSTTVGGNFAVTDWQHLTFTFDATPPAPTANLEYFVEGASAETDVSNGNELDPPFGPFHLIGNHTNNQSFSFDICDMRVYDRILSNAEISQIAAGTG